MKQISVLIRDCPFVSANDMNDKGISKNRLCVKNSSNYNGLLYRVQLVMKSKKQELEQFCANYLELPDGCLNCRIEVGIPKSKLITKNGKLVQKRHDADNLAKPIIDAFFKCVPQEIIKKDGKFHRLKPLIDDSDIMQLHIFKKLSNDDKLNITITLGMEKLSTYLEQ